MESLEPATITLAIRGPIARSDLPGLCARVSALLAGSRGAAVDCDVAGIAPDAVAIDALARLQLTAQRHGCRIRLRHAAADLMALVAFLGLGDVLAC